MDKITSVHYEMYMGFMLLGRLVPKSSSFGLKIEEA
jgi:hypothetical protein